MASTGHTGKLHSSDLCVPIYLNQQIVFDLLATIEDGFAQFSEVPTCETASAKAAGGGGAMIGASNVFALLGISFEAKKSKEQITSGQTETTVHKIHTPTSLFVKVREALNDSKQIKTVNTALSVTELTSGQFVEFQAVLRKSPLVDGLEGMKKLAALYSIFTGNVPTQSKPVVSKGPKVPVPEAPISQFAKLVAALLDEVTIPGTMELLADMSENDIVKAVLTAKNEYFTEKDASETIDGEFRVLGKVIRVIRSGSEESISLLRKTSLGRLDKNTLDGLVQVFEQTKQSGLNFQTLVTEVKGPAIQVVPIAIYA